MASDPADLIREVDALFVDMDHGYSCGTEQAKILVRRLRDALEAERAALAEERVTVLQWQQECRDQFPDLDDNCGPDEVASAIHMLRVERNNAFAAIRNMQENNLHREAALAEANTTIERQAKIIDAVHDVIAYGGDDPDCDHIDYMAVAVSDVSRALKGEQP